jgi:hypothetical protein
MGVSFKDDYVKMDEKYGDQMYKMFGPTLLGFPLDVDASRLYMNTSETKQSLTLIDPDVARIQTGWERPLGKLNRAYKELKGTWEVVAIIPKFKNGFIYTMVLYNHDTDTYDMIEKQIAESLTEKFGYVYNTEVMDKLNVGDKVTDCILYKSTSYDQYMNYRYGKNAKVYYSTSTPTLEDAVLIRQGWADGVKSVEVDEIQVPINDNHVLLNLYGDDENYKICPDLGEHVKNSVICATRVINKNHLFVDMQPKNLREIYNTDTDYYANDDPIVYDINIYYNNPNPFPDNVFYHQLKGYYDDICKYTDQIYEWTRKIKSSSSHYTDNVSYLKSIYQHFNDPEYKWKNKDKAFGNMVVEFKVKSIIGLDSGSKLAGRYGDKGVVSKSVSDSKIRDMVKNTMDSILDVLGREINDEERSRLAEEICVVPDSQMPYTDEFPVDIILNASGAIRRLNSGQIYEVDLNFISESVRRMICTLSTIEEKENMIFDFLSMVNKDQYEFFYNMYKNYDKYLTINHRTVRLFDDKSKLKFIQDIEKNGFYLIKPPDSNIRYETVKALYEHFDFIKPLPLYIDIFGTRRRRIIKDGVVGDKYMMVLKHNNNKNFSARSTFRVNRANMPAKDNTKRNNRSAYSKNPIRIGESYNLMAAISGALLAEYNIFMRSSTLGRRSLQSILETEGNPLEIKRLKVQDNYVNANADILNAKLKSIGIKIELIKEGDDEPDMLYDAIMPLYIGKYVIYDSPLKKPMYNQLFRAFDKYVGSIDVVESYEGEKEDLAWKYVFDLPEIKELDIPDFIKEMVNKASKNHSEPITENPDDFNESEGE